MPDCASVLIHHTQWPASFARQLRQCLQVGRVNPKFLYQTPRQVRQWLKVHDAYSPARRAADFHETYEPAFGSAVARAGAGPVHLIGLGCGGGEKEAALLDRLLGDNRRITFTAMDGSSGMVITALQEAWKHLEPAACSGLVCDLAAVEDLGGLLDRVTPRDAVRMLTFFGMIPNLEPDRTVTLLRHIARPGDVVLCSANLAPGSDYRAGVEQVLPQYDNPETREWLGLLLADLGVADDAGRIRFRIQEAPGEIRLFRIKAFFEFERPTTVWMDEEPVEFPARSCLELLFSDRHTLPTMEQLLGSARLDLVDAWVAGSGEEGVFLALRPRASKRPMGGLGGGAVTP